MKQESIAHKTAQTSLWGAVEKIASMGVQFIVTMVLARLLSPEDYGLIAMIMVFIAISQQFVECGIVNALIRKNDCTSIDYSTAFYFNIFIAFIVYAILICIAPLISHFYGVLLLTPIIRIYGICIILQSFTLVQNAILIKELKAKKLAFITTISSLLSGVVGIICAYMGTGVWALVVQSLLSVFLTNLLLWTKTNWKPSIEFSRESMNYLWSFGSKMLLTGIISSIYRNIYSIVIGKKFDMASVGVFNRGQKLAELFPEIMQSVFVRNSLPIMANVQNDKTHLVHVYREFIILVSFLTFPVVFLLGVLAKPFVLFFLSEKWIESVIFVQMFCIVCITYPPNAVNLNLIQVYGRSDITLKAEIIKKTIGIIVVFAMLPFGLIPLACGSCVMYVLAYAVNLYYAKKIAGISFASQLLDIKPCFVSSIVMAISVYLSCMEIEIPFLQLAVGTLVGGVVYFCMTKYVYKLDVYNKIINIINKK